MCHPFQRVERTKPFSTIRDVYELLQLARPSQYTGWADTAARFQHKRVKAGHAIYRIEQAFEALYIVRFGFLKMILNSVDGDERVLSFAMEGDFFGLDGIYHDRYAVDSIALTDCELIVIPFKQLITLVHSNRELEKIIYLTISRELLRGLSQSLLNNIKAPTRVARFLETQASSYASRGYSSQNFLLPMSRRDIGSYLGLSLETVSRSLSAMASAGVISIDRRHIQILKPELLH